MIVEIQLVCGMKGPTAHVPITANPETDFSPTPNPEETTPTKGKEAQDGKPQTNT
jgi:hypothetical protein